MACFYPIRAYRGARLPSGKRAIVFKKSGDEGRKPLELPCGRCVGCRLEWSRQWAVRCMNEADTRDENCFITLTYDDEHLPEGGTLVKGHLEEFLRKCRDKFPSCSWFAVGEYGEKFARPHYHILGFGFDFADGIVCKKTEFGDLRISVEAQEMWGRGLVAVGSVSFQSASYCARYVMKKVSGEPAADHYKGRVPEFMVVTKQPGIGRHWLVQNAEEVLRLDCVYYENKQGKVPEYYDTLLAKWFPDRFEKVKKARAIKEKFSRDYTSLRRPVMVSEGSTTRLRAKEDVLKSKIGLSRRNYEIENV